MNSQDTPYIHSIADAFLAEDAEADPLIETILSEAFTAVGLAPDDVERLLGGYAVESNDDLPQHRGEALDAIRAIGHFVATHAAAVADLNAPMLRPAGDFYGDGWDWETNRPAS